MGRVLFLLAEGKKKCCEKTEMRNESVRGATVQERRNERGSGIGRSKRKVDPTGHQQERCGERGLEKWEERQRRTEQ